MYAPYMATSGNQGAVTSKQTVTLLIVFSEAVSGLTTSNFKVCCFEAPSHTPCIKRFKAEACITKLIASLTPMRRSITSPPERRLYICALQSKLPLYIQVSGPVGATVTALKLLRGTISYYHLVVQLPATFYGQTTVAFVVSFDTPLMRSC